MQLDFVLASGLTDVVRAQLTAEKEPVRYNTRVSRYRVFAGRVVPQFNGHCCHRACSAISCVAPLEMRALTHLILVPLVPLWGTGGSGTTMNPDNLSANIPTASSSTRRAHVLSAYVTSGSVTSGSVTSAYVTSGSVTSGSVTSGSITFLSSSVTSDSVL